MRPAAILLLLAAIAAFFPFSARSQTPDAGESVNTEQLAAIRQNVEDGFTMTALSKYVDLRARDPRWTYCHYNIGHGLEGYLLRLYDMSAHPALYEDNHLPRARDELLRVLTNDPSDVEALRELGLLYGEVEAFFDAVDIFDEALLVEPDNADLLVLRTLARLGMMTGGLLTTDNAQVFAYYDPQGMVADMSRATALGADGFLALWADAAAHSVLLYADSSTELLATALARYDAAIDVLPTMRQRHLYPLLSYMVHEGRASVLLQMNDLDAFHEEMAQAIGTGDFGNIRDSCAGWGQ